jgi:hypothetical protein
MTVHLSPLRGAAAGLASALAMATAGCTIGDIGDGPAAPAGACEEGAIERRACEATGEQTRTCAGGQWSEWSACDTSPACADGEQQTAVCGENDRGTQERWCESGQWSAWSPCADDDVCRDGDLEQEACGALDSGLRTRSCVAGAWGEWSPCAANPVLEQVLTLLDTADAAALLDGYALVSMRTSETDLVQSTEYRWHDFLSAFRTMATTGIGGEVFYVGGDAKVALVNIAALLAQSMQETIQYDACDENNWTIGLGVPDYPASAACGQAGQDYQAYHCSAAEEHMECPVDPQMMVMARTHAAWYGAPPPLFCAPRAVTGERTPRWNPSAGWCDPGAPPPVPDFLAPGGATSPWIDGNLLQLDQATCAAYPGQKAGLFTFSGCPADGCWNSDQVDTAGGQLHDHVEGCCWWGRGVIQTTGVCNFGKLNYYLAGREYLRNAVGERVPHQYDADAPYADLDFCADPEVVCDGPGELKWIAGMLYWLNSVQGYPPDDAYQWDFEQILDQDAAAIFAAPDGAEAQALIDATSGVVNRGCPALTCPGSGAVHGADARRAHFRLVLSLFRHLLDPATYPPPAGPPAPPAA